MKLAVGAVALAIAPIAPRADTKPVPTLSLGWPASTKSVRAVRTTDVMVAIRSGDHYGRLANGSRVGWTSITPSKDACGGYVEIEPRGWVCARDVVPSDEPPLAAEPGDPDQVLAQALATPHMNVVPAGALAYATRADAARKDGKKLDGWTPLLGPIDGLSIIDGTLFVKTIAGFVAANDLLVRPTSELAGEPITAASPWPFAWVVSAKTGDIDVLADAATKAAKVKTIAPRTRVAVLDTKNGYVRIADNEWIAKANLRVAKSSKRPDGVRADERWLDVDLDEEVMVAYEGDRPVWATLVSTGFGAATPTSLHRIVKKHARMTMSNPASALGTWNIPDVPFVMEFRKYYSIHAAYWHDSFGLQRGHGCVNVSPRDAHHLYEWTVPAVPPGWSEANAIDQPGTPIRIRNRKVPNPPWTKFNTEPPVPQKDTSDAVAAE